MSPDSMPQDETETPDASTGVDSAMPPPEAREASPADVSASAGPPSADELVCDKCGGGPYKSRAGLVSHARWCTGAQKRRVRKKPRPISLDDAYRAPATATEAAERAKAALIGDPEALDGASRGEPRAVGKLVSRLAQGRVGVPELGALACETALPPPLKDTEYTALCAVWGEDSLDIPPNVLKFLVTVSIFGPRVASHETLGPALKKLATRIGEQTGLIKASKPATVTALPSRPRAKEPEKTAEKEPSNNKPAAPPVAAPPGAWDNV